LARIQPMVESIWMKSSARGKSTSAAKRPAVEVLNVSPHGIWLSVAGEEHFLSHADFPWFRTARLEQIFKVELHHGAHLRWPDLDVDLHVDSLRHPERFPLRSRR
jgi:hypothetical protein